MAILQVIDGRERDLGGFVVRRVLPFQGWQKTRWAEQRFPSVPVEIEFAPLPHT